MLNLAVPSMTFDNIRQMRALDFSLSLPHLAFITHRLHHSQIPEVQAIGFKEKHTYTHIHTYIHTYIQTHTHLKMIVTLTNVIRLLWGNDFENSLF